MNFKEHVQIVCNIIIIYLSNFSVFSQHNGANIQLLDLPGIIEGASQGQSTIYIILYMFCYFLIMKFFLICSTHKFGFPCFVNEPFLFLF